MIMAYCILLKETWPRPIADIIIFVLSIYQIFSQFPSNIILIVYIVL